MPRRSIAASPAITSLIGPAPGSSKIACSCAVPEIVAAAIVRQKRVPAARRRELADRYALVGPFVEAEVHGRPPGRRGARRAADSARPRARRPDGRADLRRRAVGRGPAQRFDAAVGEARATRRYGGERARRRARRARDVQLRRARRAAADERELAVRAGIDIGDREIADVTRRGAPCGGTTSIAGAARRRVTTSVVAGPAKHWTSRSSALVRSMPSPFAGVATIASTR